MRHTKNKQTLASAFDAGARSLLLPCRQSVWDLCDHHLQMRWPSCRACGEEGPSGLGIRVWGSGFVSERVWVFFVFRFHLGRFSAPASTPPTVLNFLPSNDPVDCMFPCGLSSHDADELDPTRAVKWARYVKADELQEEGKPETYGNRCSLCDRVFN